MMFENCIENWWTMDWNNICTKDEQIYITVQPSFCGLSPDNNIEVELVCLGQG